MDSQQEVLDPEQSLADLLWVRRLAMALVSDDSVAEDVSQQVWEAALKRRDQEKPPTRAWLAGTLRNLTAHWHRTAGRRRRREKQAAQLEALPSTAELVERNEMQCLVMKDLASLQEPFRTTLWLRFQEELKPTSIATLQGLSVDTVRWRIRRGLELLRERMRQRFGSEWRAGLIGILPMSIRSGFPQTLTAGAVPALPLGGWIMGKKLLLIGFLFLFALAIVPLLADRTSAEVHSDDNAAVRVREVDPSGGEFSPSAAINKVDSEKRKSLRARKRTALERGVCVLVGKIEDAQGRSLSQIKVRARSLDGWDCHSLSNSQGEFVLELPSFDSPEIHFEVIPGFYHETRKLVFGDSRFAAHESLVAGEHDLGILRLADTGVASGSVYDAMGRPVPGAYVYWWRKGNKDSRRSEGTDKKGSYQIGHLLPGIYEVTVYAYGFKVETIERRIEVGPASRSTDIHLKGGASIQGVVKDETGAPISGASVFAGGYIFAFAEQSDSLGRFRVYLGDQSPWRPRVMKEGYQSLVPEHDVEPIPAGSENVVLVLQKLEQAMTTFKVLDETSGKPIEEFGIYILQDHGAQGDASRRGPTLAEGDVPDMEEHLFGEVTLEARPGIDRYFISAPGYRSRQGEVQHSSPEQEIGQVITMVPKRIGQLTGLVHAQGVPVAGARVRLYQGAYERVHAIREGARVYQPEQEALPVRQSSTRSYRLELRDEMPPPYRFQLDRRYITSTRTSEDGGFAVKIPRSGRYVLTIEGETVGQIRCGPMDLESEEQKDLGLLEFELPATLRGRLEFQHPTSLSGHEVRLNWPWGSKVVTDTTGLFEFQNLRPGEHYLDFRLHANVKGERPWTHFLRLEEAEHRELVVVVKNEPVCEVRAQVTRNGKPWNYELILFRSLSSNEETTTLLAGHSTVRAIGHSEAWIQGDGFFAPISGLRVQLAAGQTVSISTDLQCGSIRVELPRSLTQENASNLILRMRQVPEIASERSLRSEWRCAPILKADLDHSESTIFQLSNVPCGDAEIELQLLRFEQNAVTWIDPYGEPEDFDLLWEENFSVKIAPSETLVLEMP